MELVQVVEVARLGQEHEVAVAPGAHEREGPQQVPVDLCEVLAGGEKFALVAASLLHVETAPRRVDSEEGVLDEMAFGHD